MSPERILLVEDDPDIRAVAELALGSLGGFIVTAVADGPAALAHCAMNEPDLVVLDFLMPGMNGLETLAAIRQRGTRAPAVFVTATMDAPSGFMNTSELGVIGVIGKPFDAIGLAAAIRRLWNEHAVDL